MNGLRLPSERATRLLGVGAVTWIGHVVGLRFGGAAVGVAVVVGAAAFLGRRRVVVLMAAFIALGAFSAMTHAVRQAHLQAAPVPEGRVSVVVRARTDPLESFGWLVLIATPTHIEAGDQWQAWDGPPLAIQHRTDTAVEAGNRIIVTGTLRSAPGTIRGRPFAGRLEASSIRLHDPGNLLFRIGNMMRSRVRSVLDPAASRERALLAGFLIGDVSRVDPLDMEALRRSGLTHFVAVSGSNVALFLAAWWLVAGPLARGRWLRPLVGLVGLAVFVVVTRWEPSVVRASVMAGYVLGGNLGGIPLDAWSALALTVTTLLVVTPGIGSSVGFQLSVAATMGVIAGAGLFGGRRPRPLWATLGAAISAQAAVLPVVMIHFGTVPLMSPLANVAAAPAVTAATIAGGVGTLTGSQAVVDVAAGAGRVVLEIAQIAGSWPQLGPGGVAMAGGVAATFFVKQLRPVVIGLVLIGGVMAVVPPGPPSEPVIVVLDIGQGDAVVLMGPSGESVLIDGGPDPVALQAGLRRNGVRSLDLVVVTHGDADHVGGLERLHERTSIGAVWIPDHPDSGRLLAGFVEEARAAGIDVRAVGNGVEATVGDFRLSIVGPRRRYGADNDGSVAMIVAAGGATAFLGGDVEAIAQREIGPVYTDVLLVPHHGSATTDVDWLAQTTADLAVISVGDNTYGHPSQAILDVLDENGVEVRRTDRDGDVVIPIGP